MTGPTSETPVSAAGAAQPSGSPSAWVLQRIRKTSYATYGRLFDSTGTLVCVTLELPDLGNQPEISCIPAGRYRCYKSMSPHLDYVTPELADVPGRSNIRIHIANLCCDIEGCIGVGSAFGPVEDKHDSLTKPGITGSRLAFGRMMNLLDDVETFELVITDPLAGT